jgi:hypothetical protein
MGGVVAVDVLGKLIVARCSVEEMNEGRSKDGGWIPCGVGLFFGGVLLFILFWNLANGWL